MLRNRLGVILRTKYEHPKADKYKPFKTRPPEHNYGEKKKLKNYKKGGPPTQRGGVIGDYNYPFRFGGHRPKVSGEARVLWRDFNIHNKKDIHFMAQMRHEKLYTPGGPMKERCERLEMDRLSNTWPMGKEWVGAGHTVHQSLNLQGWRRLSMMNFDVMKRKEVEQIKLWIQNSDYSKPAQRYLVHGPQYTGKTISAHSMAQWGMQNGYFVIFNSVLKSFMRRRNFKESIILRSDITTKAFVTTKRKGEFKTQYEPLMENGNFRPELNNATTYDQNDPAGYWLQNFRLINQRYLKKLKSTKPFPVSARREDDIPIGTSLLKIVDEAYSRYPLRCDGMKFLIEQIKEQTQTLLEMGHPVLVVTDDCNFLTQGCHVTIIRNVENIPFTDWGFGPGGWHKHVKYDDVVTDSRRLNGIRYLHALHNDNEWKGANIVGFTTNTQMPKVNWAQKMGKHNDRSVIEHENDLQEMLGDQGFSEMWHPFIPVELGPMTRGEKAMIGQLLWKKKIIHGRNESLLAQDAIEAMSDGVLGRFVINNVESF